MDGQDVFLHHPSPTRNFSSSIALTNTPAGLASASSSRAPSPSHSPSLDPSPAAGSGFPRRRRSWGNRLSVAGQDPLQPLELHAADTSQSGQMHHQVPLQQPQFTRTTPAVLPIAFQDDDPFYTPPIHRPHPSFSSFSSENQYSAEGTRYGTPPGEERADPGPSTASLITRQESEGLRDDDEAFLTSNMSMHGMSEGRGVNASWSNDPELDGGATPRTRRRTLRYSAHSSSFSPLSKTSAAMKNMSKTLRRASLRVVNLAGSGLESQLRLGDEEETARSGRTEDEDEVVAPDLTQALPIRGRTLGLLGPDSRLRLKLYNFLIDPWTEPFILVLIIVNAVVLTIQAFPSDTLLPDETSPARVKGYFHKWEDYVLFSLFVVFTLEAFARICVTGLLFDPEISVTSLFSKPFTATTNNVRRPPTNSAFPPTPGAPPISAASSTSSALNRSKSFTERIHDIGETLHRPFTLAAKTPIPGSGSSLGGGLAPPNTAYASAHPHTARFAQGFQSAMHTAHPSAYPLHTSSNPTFFSRLLKSDNPVGADSISLPFRLSVNHLHHKTQRNVPYLRQSWNRIDFVAICSFWIAFGLAMAGVERGKYHIGVFRAMSVIRVARLLTITSGTTTIMHSLKTARPLLTSVAYFVIFAMILFSIIGVQAFKGSLRRICVISPNLESPSAVDTSQRCGGYVDNTTMTEMGYMMADGTNYRSPKGYICPIGQVCMESENPQNNIESFDAIYNAVLQVIVIASANTWAPLMYTMIDAEFFVSCFYFIVCIVVLNFWLINLFVAVITNTFSAIRSQTKKSAFGAAPLVPLDESDEQNEAWSGNGARITSSRPNLAKIIYDYTHWCWVILALASLALQATRTIDISESQKLLLYYGELGFTLAFDFEIALRVLATLPNWRSFFEHGNNWLDTILAVVSSVIQIPAVHQSSVYQWFTIFQLGRFYRVILVVPRMRPLLLAVFGNLYGLANMSLFLLLINYIAALVAVQLLRGDVPTDQTINFGQIYNAFLGMYQVFSSENWTTILYNSAIAELQLSQAVLLLVFISAWMLFANFIVLQMFIAVINENFEVAEEAKKSRQTSNYLAAQQAQEGTTGWMRKLNPYRWMKPNPVKVKVSNLPSNLVLPMQQTMVEDGLSRTDSRRAVPKVSGNPVKRTFKAQHYSSKSLTALQKLFAGEMKSNDIPMTSLQRQETFGDGQPLDEETERYMELLAIVNPGDSNVEDAAEEYQARRAAKAEFISNFPSYDKSFWFITQKNFIRQMCQKVVVAAKGERVFGTPTSPLAHVIFQVVLLLTVVGGITVECIATPNYRRDYYSTHGLIRGSWFSIAEAAFGFTIFIEFLIKTVADGFAFTPNAYVKSIWNILDFLIMIGILVNVTTGLIFIGGLSRFTRSLKALRALRLITLIDRMRDTFQNLILSGALRIMDAAILALLYMIPYAVWGLNIFAGKMNGCNDTSGDVADATQCINEYSQTIFDNVSFAFPIPRAWNNPSPSTTFSFDNFRSSLLILFEIVSLEGWIDVMTTAMGITGVGQQPSTNASQINAIFFVIYNLMGGVVIFTLFISIIIGNFSARTGTAYLTQAQREWIDLQKLFKRQKPSKRPVERPTTLARAWCFDRAVQKHGWWTRIMTFLFVMHVAVLMTQTFSVQAVGDAFRNDFFLIITFVYIIDVLVRLYGLGWRSFRANGWNLFDIVVAGGSFITTLVVRFGQPGFATQQLQKFFLVSIAFKLVQRTNSLNMLFKTAVASLPVIMSLLGLWLILFIFFAILMVEVFGLTKWSSAETRTQNYYSIGSAMVMLAFQSTGEGWNQYMHDFDLTYPRCTTHSEREIDSDCGSTPWSFGLFIAWNLLSMYIFVNMFTGVVVQNFSYVFQASGSGAKSISREQMRAFKKLWAECSNHKTGYLERHNFAKFFQKLSGVFEVRIYPSEHNVRKIAAICRDGSRKQDRWPKGEELGINLTKLTKALNKIDYPEIRKRRAVYSRLYHEANISHEQGLGMSFTNMLMLLAHHKLIVDAEALVLEDLVIRTEQNKLVTDLANLDRVRSLLKTISCRRRFLADRERRRAAEQEIPSIVVMDVPPDTPLMSSRDISSARNSASFLNSPPAGFSAPDSSLSLEVGSRLERAEKFRSNRRNSDYSTYSGDFSSSPRSSMYEEDAGEVLAAMHNSVWGDLMAEVAEEEEAFRS